MKKRTLVISRTLGASEPLADILPPALLAAVATLGLGTVRDLATVTEAELLSLKGVGRLTLYRLRRILLSIGLDFREPSEPLSRARKINDGARSVPPMLRMLPAGDDAHVANLWAEWKTVAQCMRHGVTTLGELKALGRKGIEKRFTRKACRDLINCLSQAGLETEDRSEQDFIGTTRLPRPHRSAVRTRHGQQEQMGHSNRLARASPESAP